MRLFSRNKIAGEAVSFLAWAVVCPGNDEEIVRLEALLAEKQALKQQLLRDVGTAKEDADANEKTLAEMRAKEQEFRGEFVLCRCSVTPLCRYCLLATSANEVTRYRAALHNMSHHLGSARKEEKEFRAQQRLLRAEASSLEVKLKAFETGAVSQLC